MRTALLVLVACALCCTAYQREVERPAKLDRRVSHYQHSGHYNNHHHSHTCSTSHHSECHSCQDNCHCNLSYEGCHCYCGHSSTNHHDGHAATAQPVVLPWEDWGPWSACSATCEVGHESRHRQCKAGHTCTTGHNAELRSCDTGILCTVIQAATTTVATTHAPVTHAPVVVTTTVTMTNVAVCDKFCTVAAVAQSNSATHADAGGCPGGLHTSADALPLHCCGLTSHSHVSWTRGPKVTDNCQCNSNYGAVAMFDATGRYIAETAAVFVDCLPNGIGFQMTRQLCGSTPEIVHAEKGTMINPDAFYFVIA